jgi:hypothetical protein
MTKSKKTKVPGGKRKSADRTMRSWDDTTARIDATWAFCDYVEAHPAKLAEIKRNSASARKLMADVGQFYLAERMPPEVEDVVPIPKDAEFRIFEFDPREKRDKLMTIVLPPLGVSRAEATEIWRCSWPPWLQ